MATQFVQGLVKSCYAWTFVLAFQISYIYNYIVQIYSRLLI